MNRISILVFIGLGIALSCHNLYGGEIYKEGELLVKFKPTVSVQTARAVHQQVGSSQLKKFRLIDVELVKLPEHLTVEEGIALYKGNPNVAYAEPNHLCRVAETPDDTGFAELWGLHNTGQTVRGITGTSDADIDAPEAWNIVTGDATIIIAVIDTGVQIAHPDLNDGSNNNIWTNSGEIAGNGIDDDGNGYIDDVNGWDFKNNNNTVYDTETDDYHGTHVAGTIAGVGNNGVGVCGVMWSAKIMPLKFLDAIGGDSNGAISAIEYAAANGANIINNSWTLSGYNASVKSAIEASGIVNACAAGNNGDTFQLSYTPSLLL